MAPNPPVILEPVSGQDFSTNALNLILKGTASLGVIQVFVNGSAFTVDYDLNTFEWSYVLPNLVEGLNEFNVLTFDGTDFSTATTQVITYSPAEGLETVPVSPTGIQTRSYIDTIEIVVERPLTTTIGTTPIGYNFYYSTQTGLNFTKLNETPLEVPSEIIPGVLEVTEELLPEAQVTSYENVSGNFKIESRLRTDISQELGRFICTHTANSIVPLQLRSLAYYYITSVYLDTSNNVLVESAPSEELVTQSISIDQTVRGLPNRTRSDVAIDYINFITETDPTIDVIPGTHTRDIMIEPFANEVEKLRFLIDFNSRSNSFITLIALDDADSDGVSDLVASSDYKRKLKIALGSDDDLDVQRTIDEAFEKLAGNYNISRLTSDFSQGSVTLSTSVLKSDVIVQKGAIFSTQSDFSGGVDSVLFTSDISLSMLVENANDFFNPATAKFELTIPISALTPGTSGDVDANTITNIVSGVIGIVETTNPIATRFGSDEESNVSLAERGLLSLVGVDSGTKGGYLFSALKIPGVQAVEVVASGDPEMVRDLVLIDGVWQHVWGTVDVYIQGQGLNEAVDTFAFSNPEIFEERFTVESVVLLQFGSLNKNVNEANPIYEVTAIVNLTRGGQAYDLTGLTIIGGAVIDLDAGLATNVAIGVCETDTVRVDYKYRKLSTLIFSKQPVVSVQEVAGDLSGDLSKNFNLIRTSHPLFLGKSTRAGAYLELFFANNLPVAGSLSSTDTLSLVEEFPIALKKVGVIESSVVVTSEDGSVTYTLSVDYTLLSPNIFDNTLRIRRIPSGLIPNGAIVQVNYDHSENFTVKYSYEQVPSNVLSFYELTKHIDADVVVKSTLRSPVDIEALIIKKSTFNANTVDSRIRNNIARFFAALKNQDAVHESDIIRVIDGTEGVDFVINPLTKLSRSDNTLVLDEQLSRDNWEVLQTDVITSYISTIPLLSFNTIDKGGRDFTLNGGPGIERRIVGIREGNLFYPQVETEFEVSRVPGSSYIRSDGKVVMSFVSDRPSLTTQVPPSLTDLYATYYVYGETQARSIFSVKNELLTLGSLSLRVIDLGQQLGS